MLICGSRGDAVEAIAKLRNEAYRDICVTDAAGPTLRPRTWWCSVLPAKLLRTRRCAAVPAPVSVAIVCIAMLAVLAITRWQQLDACSGGIP